LASQYQSLYDRLEREPSFQLPSDFALRVVAGVTEPGRGISKIINSLLYSMMGAIILFLSAIFIDWRTVFGGFSLTADTFHELVNILNGEMVIFVSAVLILSFLMLFDKIVVLPRQHHI
jgi:hypothetical protein